jgi:hypothetical protein
MSINDSTSTATIGLLNNQGLNLTGTATLLAQLAAAPVISEGIAAVTASTDNILGHTTLPGLTGVVPATITNIGTGLGIPFYNTQVNSLTNTNNIPGFLSNLSQVYGFCSLAATYSVEMMNSLVLNTLGLSSQKNSLAYVTTTGLSVLLTNPIQVNVNNLATDFANTGTLYDLTDLPNLGTPGKIYSALLTANIPGAIKAQTSLINAGVDLSNLTDPISQNTILRALTNINSVSDLNAIAKAFSMSLQPQLIDSAASFTIVQKVFFASYSKLKDQTFVTMSNDLQSIKLSSAYKSFADVATFLQNITFPPNYDATCTISTSVTPDTLYSFASIMGAGSATSGTLSVIDFYQPIDPTNLSMLVNTMITALTKLSTTTEGIALIALFNSLISASAPARPAIEASIETALSNLLAGTDIASQQAHIANLAWIEIMSILSISIQAVSKSGVSLPSSAVTNKTAIMGFAQNFSAFSQDPNNLGTGKLLLNLTTADKYGAAIQCAINSSSTGS